MSDVFIVPQPAPFAVPATFGSPGAKGDPGGDITAVGLFTALSGMTVPAGADLIQTTGYGTEGKGRAIYVYDAAVDAAYVTAHPRSSVRDLASRGFRLSLEQDLYVEMVGAAGDGTTDDSAAVQALEDLRASGQALNFGTASYAFSNVKVRKPGHIRGRGKNTAIVHNGGSGVDTFGICTSGGTRVSHMRFTGLSTPDNANARFPVYVSPRSYETDTPQTMEDFEFDHLWFDGCDTGIRTSYGGTGPVDDRAGTTWWTPSRIHIHDCVFDDVLYQPIIPEAHDVLIERNYFRLSAKPVAGYRPFSHSLRILGCNRVTVRDNTFDVPWDYPFIGIMPSGVDNGITNIAYRMARNVTIESNRITGGYINVQHSADLLRIVRNNFWNDPQSTTNVPPALITVGSASFPVYFGKIEFEDNYAVGYPSQFQVELTACHRVSVKRNTIIGNKKTGGAFDIAVNKIQINDGVKLQDGVTQMPPPVLAEFEDNNFFANPSTTGSILQLVGNMTGLFLTFTGNKTTERAVAYAMVNVSALVGDPKIKVSKSLAWTPWSTNPTGMAADLAGDNGAMPSGFYAALMASSFFRAEQIVDNTPPVFA